MLQRTAGHYFSFSPLPTPLLLPETETVASLKLHDEAAKACGMTASSRALRNSDLRSCIVLMARIQTCVPWLQMDRCRNTINVEYAKHKLSAPK